MPIFHETWFFEDCQEALRELMHDVDARGIEGRVIEIGSWEGRSTLALANATTRPVHCVDHWLGSPSDVSFGIAATRDVYAVWRANVDEATAGNVVEHRMEWREFRASDDSQVALLFIDSDHAYTEVRATLDAFVPLMASGGIICGDDADFPGVHQALTERFDTHEVRARVWFKEMP